MAFYYITEGPNRAFIQDIYTFGIANMSKKLLVTASLTALVPKLKYVLAQVFL